MINIDSTTKVPLLKNFHAEEENTVSQLLLKNKWAILGGFCALSSCLAFTFYGLFVKQFDVEIADLLFVRSVIHVILASLFIAIRQKNFFPSFENDRDNWITFKKYSILVLQVSLSVTN